jgi:hypothetical protein
MRIQEAHKHTDPDAEHCFPEFLIELVLGACTLFVQYNMVNHCSVSPNTYARASLPRFVVAS